MTTFDRSEHDRPVDIDQLAERYRREREKRVRSDGAAQYTRVTDAFLSHDADPHAGPDTERTPLHETPDVVVIGGGWCGMLIAVRLIQAGVDNIRIIERGADFGGTWYWNRYPGLACDIESYVYIPLLEELGYVPSEKYARGDEIYGHVQNVAKQFGLYDRAALLTAATGMRWCEDEHRWIVETDRGDELRARFVVTAGGLLHKPKLPDVDGLADFKGKWFHTSRWDYGYTGGDTHGGLTGLADKRVGIIGTGATAVQCIPHLGEWAKHLHVFQRTPSSIDVRANRPTDMQWAASLDRGWQRRRMDNFNLIVSGREQPEDMVGDAWTENFRMLFSGMRAETDPARQAEVRQMADFQKMERIRARVSAIVEDPATAEALKPYYNLFCKRPCFHDAYLDTFNRPNVTLVDTQGAGVDAITCDRIVAQGREYPLDCIIFATGFEFELSVDYTRRLGFEVLGRDGRSLSEAWKNGALTLHGMHTHGFPNYLICSTLQAGLSPSITHLLDQQAHHVAYIVDFCLAANVQTVEVEESAQREWVDTIVTLGEGARRMMEGCTPGYVTNEGQQGLKSMRNALYGGGAAAFFELLQAWREDGTLAGLALLRE